MFVKDQQTKILDQGAKQDRPRGEGSNKKGQKEPNKTKQQERTRKSHPSTEERNRTRKTTRRTDRSTKQNKDPKNPAGQRIKGTTKPPKGQRAAQTLILQRVVRLTLVKGVLQFWMGPLPAGDKWMALLCNQNPSHFACEGCRVVH